MSAVLDIDIRHRFGDFALEARLRSEGRLTVLFGRSGSGKTSLVNLIGGLVKPDAGRIVVQGETLVDSAAGIFVPRHRRRIGYVFQEARLFPHLTVAQNLRYGAFFAPRGATGPGFGEVVEMLGIGHLVGRRPQGLSGGEKQRVAIGRALLSRPRLLLMDEPLASLDEPRKAEILPFIERLRDDANIPIVYVSHAIAEVLRLATTLVLLRAGRVEAVGSPAEVLGRHDLVGAGVERAPRALIEARVLAHDERYALTVLDTRAGPISVPRLALAVGAPARLAIAAQDVMVSPAPPGAISALNVIPGRIAALAPAEGAEAAVDVALDCNGETIVARITARSRDLLGLAPGEAVHAVIKSVALAPPAIDG